MTVRVLPGEWRHKPGKRPTHLWPEGADWPTRRPLCGARVARRDTVRVHVMVDSPEHRACSDCMVQAIGGRDYGKEQQA